MTGYAKSASYSRKFKDIVTAADGKSTVTFFDTKSILKLCENIISLELLSFTDLPALPQRDRSIFNLNTR